MQRNIKRIIAAALLGCALAFSAIGAGPLGQPAAVMACPGNGTSGGGGC